MLVWRRDNSLEALDQGEHQVTMSLFVQNEG